MKSEKTVSFQSNGKTVHLYSVPEAAPLVIYHAVMGEGRSLWKACLQLNCPDFSLAVVNGVDWNDEMSPWPIPPISRGDTPCSGGADKYLSQLTDELLPKIKNALPSAPEYCALAGYSLAGLFAVYAAHKTDCFSRIASASGSLWYPDFIPFVRNHAVSEKTKAIYFSLGDKESHTKNRYLAPVEDNTRYLARYFSEEGIKTTFQMNSGNHYHNQTGRMAAGIQWILQQQL